MEVDANIIIDKLCGQITQMVKAMVIKDAQIELLQGEIAKLSAK